MRITKKASKEHNNEAYSIKIKPPQDELSSIDMTIPNDFSSAAFLLLEPVWFQGLKY